MRLFPLQNVLIGTTAALFAGVPFANASVESDPAPSSPAARVKLKSISPEVPSPMAKTKAALEALASAVRPLSHPKALENAFRGYFTYKAAHPGAVKKPFLYFVDYGLPSMQARGYLFDMSSLSIVDGPFTVAHGRGSAEKAGIPTRFSNAFNSASTSLGLYLAQETYNFHGKSGGRGYNSVGMRLAGVSGNFNGNARGRGVVAHGAPYVTASKAGRSEGCPAMEPARAERLLPKLANGGMVFLFAPDARWLSDDPWVAASDG